MTDEEPELHELQDLDSTLHMAKVVRVIKARRVQIAWCGGYGLPVGDGVPHGFTRIINHVTCPACATAWTDNINSLFGDGPETTLLQQAVRELEQHQDATSLTNIPAVRVWRPSEHFASDQPPAASEYGLGLPGAVPRDIVQLPGVTRSGVGDDGSGIYLHPADWNIQRLSGREEALLAYFFKLIYMERVRQIKKWGDQRRPDGVDFNTYHPASVLQKQRVEDQLKRGRATWIDVLLEEVYEAAECDPVTELKDMARPDDRDLEKEMVQSAAVLAAWFSDICRRAQESLDEGMEGM